MTDYLQAVFAMLGPGEDSAAFSPGPVWLEFPTAGPGQPTREAHGPDREM